MPFNFNNELYSNGSAGLVDFIWLWYNRLSVIIMLAILTITIVLGVLAFLSGGGGEGFVANTNFKRMNRARVGRRN